MYRIEAGNCLAESGVWCGCPKCEKHDKAYGVIDSKPSNVTAYAALVESGFSDEEAMMNYFVLVLCHLERCTNKINKDMGYPHVL